MNVPSALAPGEESQRTLLREGGRYMRAGMAVVLEALPLPCFALEPAGAGLPNGQQTGAGGPRVVFGNAALARLLNCEVQDLQGCALSQIFEERLPPELCVEGLVGQARRSDGCLVAARLTVRQLGLPGAERRLLLGTLEDLRPQRELQGRLAGGERLRAQGALVAGVAHEVNNPANLILATMHEVEGAIGQLLQPAGLSPAQARLLKEVRLMLSDAREGTQRIVDVVRDLVQLTHPEAAPAESVDLGELCEVVLRLCRPLLRAIRVERDLQPAPPVRAQRPRMFQVVLNVLINAVHALEEVPEARRTIWLRLRPEERGDRGDRGDRGGQHGVRLEIEDSGCGIPAPVLERIFEPFFTTKGAGRGTGLGLALSRTIIEQHGGALEVKSRLGQGTLVLLWLPLQGRRGP